LGTFFFLRISPFGFGLSIKSFSSLQDSVGQLRPVMGTWYVVDFEGSLRSAFTILGLSLRILCLSSASNSFALIKSRRLPDMVGLQITARSNVKVKKVLLSVGTWLAFTLNSAIYSAFYSARLFIRLALEIRLVLEILGSYLHTAISMALPIASNTATSQILPTSMIIC